MYNHSSRDRYDQIRGGSTEFCGSKSQCYCDPLCPKYTAKADWGGGRYLKPRELLG